jgi:hypothetical protein
MYTAVYSVVAGQKLPTRACVFDYLECPNVIAFYATTTQQSLPPIF